MIILKMFLKLLILLFTFKISNSINQNLLTNIIENTNKYEKIEHINIFISKSLLNYQISPLKLNFQFTCARFNTNQNFELQYIMNGRRIISIIFFNNVTDEILNIASNLLTKMHYSKIIFYYINVQKFDKIAKENDIKKLFDLTWRQGIINFILIVENSKNIPEIFQPDLMIPKRLNWNFSLISENFLFQRNHNKLNMKGEKIHSIYSDLYLRLYKIIDKNGNTTISGVPIRLISEFIKHINSTLYISYDLTLDDNPFNKDDNLRILELIADKKINISIIPLLVINQILSDQSYPISFSYNQLVIPNEQEIPKYLYLILPFDNFVWFIIFIVYFLISLLIFITEIILQNYKNLSQIFCIVLNIILMNPFFNEKIQLLTLNKSQNQNSNNNKTILRLILILIFVLGFILTNIYKSLMTSFLTETVYTEQIKTIEDFLMKNYTKILCHLDKAQFILNLNFYSNELKNFLKIVDEYEETKALKSLNISYSYFDPTERWDLISKQQKYLKRPLLRRTKINFGTFLLSFPLPYDSILTKSLNIFIMYVHQSGLFQYWLDNSFDELRYNKQLKLFHDNTLDHVIFLKFKHFILAWSIICYGYIISIMCFIIEIFYENTKEKIKIFLLKYRNSKNRNIVECQFEFIP